MRLTLQRGSVNWNALAWGVTALLVGAVFAILPLTTAASILAISVLVVFSLIDVRVGLIVTLVIAPMKVLIETEVALLPIDIGQIAFGLTLAIWLARQIAARNGLKLRWSPMLIPPIVFFVAASFSMWNTVAIQSTIKELILWIQIIVMIAFTVSLLARKRDSGESHPHWLIGGLVLAGCVQAVIGIYQFRGGSGAPHLWILDYKYFRAFGTFGQPNPFGAFMGLSLVLALGAFYGCLTELLPQLRISPLSSRLRRGKGLGDRGAVNFPLLLWTLLYGAGAGLLGVGLIVSWSRGAWMGFVAAATMMLLFAPRRLWVGITLVTVLLGGGLLVVVTGLAPQSLVARFSDFTQELTSYDDVRGIAINDANYAVVERIAHWQAAVAMATDHPFFGVGFGAYEPAYPQYALMNWPMALGHAHNYYLTVLAETGIVGFVGYVVAWGLIFMLTLRLLYLETGFIRGVVLGLLGVWTHFSVHNFFDNLYVNNMFLHLGAMLGLIGGLLLRHHYLNRTRTSAEFARQAIQ